MSKTLLTTAAILLAIVFNALGQKVIGVVEYVKADNPKQFLEIEEEWHKIYKELIKQDEIFGCSVYQVLYKTKEEDYNFIKILWFDSFSKINFRFQYDHFKDAYPTKTESDWKDLQRRSKNAYEVLSSGVFQQQASCSNGLDHLGKFYRINEIKIQPGKSKDFQHLIQEVYLPVYQEDVKNSNRTVWSVWAKWTGTLDSFQYTTADGYANMDQIEEDRFADYFKKVHPTMDMNQVSNEMKDLSLLVNSEMWKLIYRILE